MSSLEDTQHQLQRVTYVSPLLRPELCGISLDIDFVGQMVFCDSNSVLGLQTPRVSIERFLIKPTARFFCCVVSSGKVAGYIDVLGSEKGVGNRQHCRPGNRWTVASAVPRSAGTSRRGRRRVYLHCEPPEFAYEALQTDDFGQTVIAKCLLGIISGKQHRRTTVKLHPNPWEQRKLL